MSEIDEMRNFVRVVDAGGISRAAEQAGMAKSGVSRRLSDLEARLGTRLLNRTTRRQSLTDAGRDYYQGAIKLLGDLEELDGMVSGESEALTGNLRLALPLSFGLAHLGRPIDEFTQLHPGLRLNIDFSDRQIDLVEQGIDLGVRVSNLADSSLRARRLCTIHLALCASPDYLARHGTPRSMEELAKHKVLQYDIGGGQRLRMRDDDGQEVMMPTSPHLVANNGDFLSRMAVCGLGLTMSPTFIAGPALRDGRLVPVLRRNWPEPLAAWAVYPQTRYLSQRARVFIDFMVERLGDPPEWDKGLDFL